MRILVVEDELHLQKTICKRLEMETSDREMIGGRA